MKTTRLTILILITIGLTGAGVYCLKFFELDTASMGDWGDYIGGLVGLVTIIWLIAGHFENQAAIRRTNEELSQQAELTRELVGALTRIASGTQVQAAEVLSAAEPRFVRLSATPNGNKRFEMRSTAESGYISLRNDGGSCSITEVQSNCEDYTVEYNNSIVLHEGTTFQVQIKSAKQLGKAGELNFRMLIRDKFGRKGVVEYLAKTFDASPSIITTMGDGFENG